MNMIDQALAIAVRVHAGQVDRGGRPYILHPLRLMHRCQSDEEMMVALLHDTVEDGDITLKDLREAGFSDEIMNAVDCLTKREGEGYEQFVERICPNDLARRVKILDIEDNMNISRLNNLQMKDFERLLKYHKALGLLRSQIND